jgi:maleate isomerase
MVLGRDPVCETECNNALTSQELSLHVARIPDPIDFTREPLAALAQPIADVARTLLRDDRLDVIAVACSAAAMAIGRESLSNLLRLKRPELKVTDPGAAAIAVLKAAGVRRISLLLTTSDPAINERTVAVYEAEGIDVIRALTLGLADDRAMSTLGLDSIQQSLIEADDPSAEVILVPCTAMRTWQAIPKSMNSRLSGRVLTGNRAMMIHAMCLASDATLPRTLEQLTPR